jgi:hypothetical protein
MYPRVAADDGALEGALLDVELTDVEVRAVTQHRERDPGKPVGNRDGRHIVAALRTEGGEVRVQRMGRAEVIRRQRFALANPRLLEHELEKAQRSTSRSLATLVLASAATTGIRLSRELRTQVENRSGGTGLAERVGRDRKTGPWRRLPPTSRRKAVRLPASETFLPGDAPAGSVRSARGSS